MAKEIILYNLARMLRMKITPNTLGIRRGHFLTVCSG